jgi:hypothetical protein
MPVYLPLYLLQIGVEFSKLGRFGFGLPFAGVPVGFEHGMFYGEFTSGPVDRDPGGDGNFTISLGFLGAQDEVYTKTVVAFHTIIFLGYQWLFERLRYLKKVPKHTSGAAFRRSGDLKGIVAF